jgi:magnesium-transporting ATPase (P-type)
VVEEDKNKNLIYQGPSPDEITLVDAAKNMGFIYRKSDNQYIYIQVLGKEERFELLSIHPFTSDRKRMSVIIRHNGLIKMFVKGVMSFIFRPIVLLRRD